MVRVVNVNKNHADLKTLFAQIRVGPEIATILQTGVPLEAEEPAPELEVEEQEQTQGPVIRRFDLK